MNTATDTKRVSGHVLVSFLLPHPLLELAAPGDTPEVLSAKERRNKAWLQRWMPVYFRRWGVIFGVFWVMSTLAPSLELPSLLISALEFAQYVSAATIVSLTVLYLPSRR